VQETASLWKEREVIFSQFWEAAGSRPAAPANSKHAISNGTESLNPSAVKSDRLDYFRYADFSVPIRRSQSGFLPVS
jgi:hypothetical protein